MKKILAILIIALIVVLISGVKEYDQEQKRKPINNDIEVTKFILNGN